VAAYAPGATCRAAGPTLPAVTAGAAVVASSKLAFGGIGSRTAIAADAAVATITAVARVAAAGAGVAAVAASAGVTAG
jgi:hypothetical protein